MNINRKKFIGAAGVLAAGAVLPIEASPTIIAPNRNRVLRIAHITDVHVQPEAPAPHGLAAALHTIQSMGDKPDIIFNTGDSIMDSLSAKKERVRDQWKVWNDTLKNENSLEVVHAIGNHDVWGWSMPNAGIRADDHYGKKWAVESLGIKNRFYSFNKAGWHFVVLDSTHPTKTFGYTAKLDEEQMEWLKQDLAATPKETNTCILSHIPILGVSVFFDGDNMKRGKWNIPGAWMHSDAKQLKDLFHQHKNVKLCLSGHIHLVDKAEYLGVKYLCNGAVSGAWWGGSNQEFPPAFAIVDLYDDGTSESEMVYYKM